MKWLIVFASFLIGKLNSISVTPSLFFVEKALEKSRNILFMATIAFISAALFCAGVIISVLNALTQIDANGSMVFSATFSGGLVLIVISAVSLAIVFAKRNWEFPSLTEAAHQSRRSSPIEEAITMLVQDFMEDRRTNRENPPPPPPRAHEPPPPEPPHAHVH